MRVALLCCGPSLGRTWPPARNRYDAVIAVNRAALLGCDYWACLDSPMLRRFDDLVPAKPRLLTRAEYRPRFSSRAGWTVEQLAERCPVPKFADYSATAGLVLAGHIGATAVDVFGADWTPEPPAPFAENRSAERFAREREIWDAVVKWLGERGVTVERVGIYHNGPRPGRSERTGRPQPERPDRADF